MVPRPSDVLNALRLTSPEETSVIILGQDPYIRGEAHGLAFSSITRVTPSLEIIFKELERSQYPRTNPNLTSWAEQGVLLLNTILTTRLGVSLAHQGRGWEEFTTAVLRHRISLGTPLVVMAWGLVAQEFYNAAVQPIETNNVYLLKACHPVYEHRTSNGCFVGCNHFVLANQYLVQNNKQPIQWNK